MTAHVQDHDHSAPMPASRRRRLPRWLVPGMLIVIVATALVAAGIVPITTMFYAGTFGAMLLMHVGGHGSHGSQSGHVSHGSDGRQGTQGGHGDHSRDAEHAVDETIDARHELDDQPRSRGCH